ncbi:unnamed protein product [Cyprideis torosa]|uniref:Uncharacterized protein n=1 Tax=Cyprideis torosa TaxID=163714 RepID=A0A7R8W3J4_9CRUS|nr:unnamed protein product [Cyprideis torosa]CAG0883057.1 unnamed protein product [Cyprideis torosa]
MALQNAFTIVFLLVCFGALLNIGFVNEMQGLGTGLGTGIRLEDSFGLFGLYQRFDSLQINRNVTKVMIRDAPARVANVSFHHRTLVVVGGVLARGMFDTSAADQTIISAVCEHMSREMQGLGNELREPDLRTRLICVAFINDSTHYKLIRIWGLIEHNRTCEQEQSWTERKQTSSEQVRTSEQVRMNKTERRVNKSGLGLELNRILVWSFVLEKERVQWAWERREEERQFSERKSRQSQSSGLALGQMAPLVLRYAEIRTGANEVRGHSEQGGSRLPPQVPQWRTGERSFQKDHIILEEVSLNLESDLAKQNVLKQLLLAVEDYPVGVKKRELSRFPLVEEDAE